MSGTIVRRVAVRKTPEKTKKAERKLTAEETVEETHVWRLTDGQREAEEAISQWFFNESRQIFVLSAMPAQGKRF